MSKFDWLWGINADDEHSEGSRSYSYKVVLECGSALTLALRGRLHAAELRSGVLALA